MSHTFREEQPTIFDIVDKLYEHRNQKQHNIINDLLANVFDTLTSKMLKLISFFIQRISGPLALTTKQFSSQTFFLIFNVQSTNPQTQWRTETLARDKKVVIQENQQAIVIDYTHYLNCQSLGQTSIDEQVNFMHSSEFLCSIPKRRLYHILRKSVIKKYSIGQTVYQEGQQIQPGQSGSGIYLVRRGDFGYYKKSERQKKQIETLSFTKGHLFGTLQVNNKAPLTNRQFTVKCKSHSGLVFNISQQVFSNHLKPYCEQIINTKQAKLTKYLDTHLEKAEKVRQPNSTLLSQTFSRGFSLADPNFNSTTSSRDLPQLAKTRYSLSRTDPIYKQPLLSQRIQQQGAKKVNYLSLTKQGPLKVYPMASQRANFTESQFREFTRLQKNKETFGRIKQLQQTGKCSASKGQILFSFFKQMWNFDKERKSMFRRRYG